MTTTSGTIGPRHWAVLVVIHLVVGLAAVLGAVNLLVHHAWLGATFCALAATATAVSFWGRRGERRQSGST